MRTRTSALLANQFLKFWLPVIVAGCTLLQIPASAQPPSETNGAPVQAPPAPGTDPQTAAAPGAPSATTTPALDTAAQNAQPAFYVHAELNRAAKDFREGEQLGLKVTCEIDAYLYVLYQQSDGKIFQIFPNQIQKNNRVAAKQQVLVPAQDDLFRWVIEKPFGKEVVKVLACRKQIDDLSDPAARSKLFNPVSGAKFKSAERQLSKGSTADWAEVDLELFTYAKSEAPAPAGSKRFGVFFGVSNYQFNDEYVQALAKRGKKGKLNLRAGDKDAQTLSELMSDVGQLNDLRVFVNEQATRAAMEDAITRWLPTVSRPGDTVFIHFSGHGSAIADDNGDETGDHQDEIVIPYDVIDTAVLGELVEKRDKLDPRVANRLPALLDIYQKNPDAAWDNLMRATCVTDDVFGRWLQHLAGRQVVVILDSCHSGGLATQEKGVAKGAPQPGIDFLEGEMARLKDIGERDQAMLSAAMRAEKALELSSGQNGVLTGFLIEFMKLTQGPVRLEDGFRYCEIAVPKYCELLNQQLAAEGYQERVEIHHPFLVNYCNRPVYLKP